MTTLTPESMRELAGRADEAGSYEVVETGLVDELATNLRAAADQLEAAVASEESATQQVFDLLDERAKLRAVIENAPHDLTKQHAWHGLDMTLCRCWKADAL